MRHYLLPTIIWLITTLLPADICAQPAIPREGLKAEMAGRWEEALEVYKSTLEGDPDSVELWLRISDIHASLGRPEEASAALAVAATLSPMNPRIHFRLAQAYSTSDQPELAFEAVERAVELEPDNVVYLEARAQIANWIGRSDVAARTYERILKISPEEDAILLSYARSSAWSGHTDKAAEAYKEYLDDHPEAEKVYIEHVKVESWRGNYAESLSILGHYRDTFGESREYRGEMGRILAWADRPREAMKLIVPLLDENPNDYDVNYSWTIALKNDRRPAEALESLKKLTELRPDSKETEDVRRVVLTPLRPDVTFAASVYTDSDDLDRYHGSIIAGFSPQPETRVTAGFETDRLKADTGTGFDTLDGDKHARHDRGWVGIEHIVSPEVAVDGHIGAAEAEGESRFIYGAGIEYRPWDELKLRVETDYGFYVISPRALDLGVRRSSNHFSADWEPDLTHTIILGLGYNDFSDGNDSWEVIAAPRRSVLRREKINLDVGVRGTWEGFEKQLDNGYYDPELYQSYMVTVLAYWKISDDDGVSVALDLGVVKDDAMDNFEFGSGVSVEATFGLYRDVMLRVGGSIFNNQRTQGGAFEAYEGHIALTFRF